MNKQFNYAMVTLIIVAIAGMIIFSTMINKKECTLIVQEKYSPEGYRDYSQTETGCNSNERCVVHDSTWQPGYYKGYCQRDGNLLSVVTSDTKKTSSSANANTGAAGSFGRKINTFAAGLDGFECEDPGYVYCGGEVCGPSREWCENWEDGGGHCKQSDPDWCCNNAGDVVCGDTDTCGPSRDWCTNFLNADKSCIPGEDWCCYDAGYIADRSRHTCCPPDYPFLGLYDGYADGLGCFQTPQSISDNYYTSASTCKVGDFRCQGSSYSECRESPKYIYNFGSSNIVKGKCGVECSSDNDCSVIQTAETYCAGAVLMSRVPQGKCTNTKCGSIIKETVVENCNYRCDEVNGIAQCIVKQCDEGALICGNETRVDVCINNQYSEKETCKNGCEEGKCKGGEYSFLIWIGVVIGILALLSLYMFRNSKFIRRFTRR